MLQRNVPSPDREGPGQATGTIGADAVELLDEGEKVQQPEGSLELKR